MKAWQALLLVSVGVGTYAAASQRLEHDARAEQDARPRCDEATDGARAGESLDERINRLQQQLRLSLAEKRVNRR